MKFCDCYIKIVFYCCCACKLIQGCEHSISLENGPGVPMIKHERPLFHPVVFYTTVFDRDGAINQINYTGYNNIKLNPDGTSKTETLLIWRPVVPNFTYRLIGTINFEINKGRNTYAIPGEKRIPVKAGDTIGLSRIGSNIEGFYTSEINAEFVKLAWLDISYGGRLHTGMVINISPNLVFSCKVALRVCVQSIKVSTNPELPTTTKSKLFVNYYSVSSGTPSELLKRKKLKYDFNIKFSTAQYRIGHKGATTPANVTDFYVAPTLLKDGPMSEQTNSFEFVKDTYFLIVLCFCVLLIFMISTCVIVFRLYKKTTQSNAQNREGPAKTNASFSDPSSRKLPDSQYLHVLPKHVGQSSRQHMSDSFNELDSGIEENSMSHYTYIDIADMTSPPDHLQPRKGKSNPKRLELPDVSDSTSGYLQPISCLPNLDNGKISDEEDSVGYLRPVDYRHNETNGKATDGQFVASSKGNVDYRENNMATETNKYCDLNQVKDSHYFSSVNHYEEIRIK